MQTFFSQPSFADCAKAVLRTTALSLSALAVTGCSLISGDKVVPTVGADRTTVSTAEANLRNKIPLMTHATFGRPLLIYKVAFDGTMNDAARVPVDELPTIVAHIRDRIGAHYYPGPGMHAPHSVSVADAAIGYSSAPTAEEAERDFFAEIGKQVASNPDIEVRVFVTGFSRGAATARHFMNIVTQDWAHCTGCTAGNRPEFFAILYDTVGTFQMDTLQLSLPSTVNFLIHVMAADELRVDFKPLIDVESDDLLVADAGSKDRLESSRIRLVILPGAHSDIGASYQEGVGDAYRSMSERWLHELGLIEQSCWESKDDPFVAGKHDSRGRLDSLILTPAPNSRVALVRKAYGMPTLHIDEVSRQALIDRLHALQEAQYGRAGTFTITPEQPPLQMTLLRKGSDLSLIELDSIFFDPASFKFEEMEGKRLISLRPLQRYGNQKTTVAIGDQMWSHLHEGRASKLTYGLLKDRQGRLFMAIDVDGLLLSAEQWNTGPTTKVPHSSYECEQDSSGNFKSPVTTMILREDGTVSELH